MESTKTEWPCDLCWGMTDNLTYSDEIVTRPDGFKISVAFTVGRYRNGTPVKHATVCADCLQAAGKFVLSRAEESKPKKRTHTRKEKP